MEMEAATVLQVAAIRGAAAACALAVSDVPGADGSLRAAPPQLQDMGVRLGTLACEALRSR